MADNEEITYTITVKIERSNLPGDSGEWMFSSIPVSIAERPDYHFASLIQNFRMFMLSKQLEQEAKDYEEPDPNAV